MTQAVEVVGEAQEQRLEVLGDGQTTGSARGELALGRREDTLDQRTLAVASEREAGPHLGANAVELPGGLTPLGGDDALSAELVANVVMIALAIERGVG